MRRVRFFFVLVLVIQWIFDLSNRWGIDYWKMAVIFLLGAVANIFASEVPKGKREEIQAKEAIVNTLEDLHNEISDAVATQPLSTNEVLDYIRTCINHFKKPVL